MREYRLRSVLLFKLLKLPIHNQVHSVYRVSLLEDERMPQEMLFFDVEVQTEQPTLGKPSENLVLLQYLNSLVHLLPESVPYVVPVIALVQDCQSHRAPFGKDSRVPRLLGD